MDRPPPINLRQPIPRGHRREHRLHDADRIHGPGRYEIFNAGPADQSDPESEPEDDDDAAGNQPRQAHEAYYQPHWETENDRWIWMRAHIHYRTMFRCIVCHRSLVATITNVRRHEGSGRHNRLMANINVPRDEEFDPHLTIEQFENEKATIKILLSLYFSDEGIAYKKVDTLMKVIKRVARYPGVLQEVKLSRTTMSKIIRYVIAPCHKQELAEMLRDAKFATLFDESTGVSKDKSGCLLVRFADHRSGRIRTTDWDVMPVHREDDEHSDATAESLYNLIFNSLFGQQLADEENRPVLRLDNYIAAGSDGCNTMIGVHNSVRQRLLLHFPGLNYVVCPCHGAHLCARHTMQVIFACIVRLLVDIYNWFISAKRLHALQQNQIRLNLDLHKILRFVEIRWLTGLPALHRVSEQLIAIDATLAEAPENQQAVQLLQRLRSPVIQLYIVFLSFILEVLEDFNGWMQTEEVILPEVFNRVSEDFKDILLCYMEEHYVENANLLHIDIEDENHFLTDDNMLIGAEARALAQTLPPDEYLNAMRVIRGFLIHLATEWFEILVLRWARFACVECLLIDNALSEEYHLAHPNIIRELADQFPRAVPQGVNIEELERQWNELVEIDLQVAPDTTTDGFWFIVRSIDDGDGIHPYLELADFALNVLITPHSNAQPERIWSIEKYIKNKYRNRLHLASVRAIIQTREMLALHGCSKKVHLYQPSADMIARVGRRLYNIVQAIIEESSGDESTDVDDSDDNEND